MIVANGATGEVLYEYRADERLPMASITKLMTALVALERSDPRAVVRIDRDSVGIGEASVGLRRGERLTLRDLLAAALIRSANDAAYAVADHVGGTVSRFVELMNERARELGLEDTRYARPDGLDAPGHYSSARDILRLARQAMRKPLVRQLVKTKKARIAGGRVLDTTNDLLRSFPGAIGVKTGFTNGAGWSEVAAARRGALTIYAVLLGGPSRAQRNDDLAELLEWGFDQYGRVRPVVTDRVYATAAIPFTDDRLPLVAEEQAVALVRLDQPLVETVVAPAMIDPPVRKGQRLGEVCVDLLKSRVCRALVAAEDVPEPGLGRRLRWYAGSAVDKAGGILESVFGGIL